MTLSVRLSVVWLNKPNIVCMPVHDLGRFSKCTYSHSELYMSADTDFFAEFFYLDFCHDFVMLTVFSSFRFVAFHFVYVVSFVLFVVFCLFCASWNDKLFFKCSSRTIEKDMDFKFEDIEWKDKCHKIQFPNRRIILNNKKRSRNFENGITLKFNL